MATLYGNGSSNFSVDPVFSVFHAYPGIWLQDSDDGYVYGSLTEETRQALEYLHGWYENGILDQDYMMRTPGEIGELIRDNRCDRDPVYWAAYASRIQAVRLIEEADVSYVNEDYVPYSHRELPQDMTDMETLAFMKIITGEEPISYFDFFTESWKKNMILENLLY